LAKGAFVNAPAGGERPAGLLDAGRPRWLADEMVGRLARYLRFFGHDVEGARGAADADIARRARDTGRTLLTRDRALAARTPGALLLHAHSIGGQLREVRAARPSTSFELRFDRCPECNVPLQPASPPFRLPVRPRYAGRPVRPPAEAFRCPSCDQLYWEGSHTARIRTLVKGWLEGSEG
jgi:uncharacterized protein